MNKIFEQLIEKICCKHHWKLEDEWTSQNFITTVGYKLYVCEKCGKFKKIVCR